MEHHTSEELSRVLDDLAHWVAARLDAGDDAAAWLATQALESWATPSPAAAVDGDADADRAEPRPPSPVIGRRFDLAHRDLLFGWSSSPMTSRALADNRRIGAALATV